MPESDGHKWHDVNSFPTDGLIVMVRSSGTGPWPVQARWCEGGRIGLMEARLGVPEQWRYMVEEIDI